ncbi:type 1 glutamine amidotransferase [Gemmatimonadota bacterium]
MKPLLIVQHLEREHAGVFTEVLERRSIPCRMARIYKGDRVPDSPKEFSGMLILGGVMNVDQADRYPYLGDEMRLIRLAHDTGVPVLGICLGSQLMAAALDSPVYDGGVREIGWYEVELTAQAEKDPLFLDFPERFNVLQWHGQTFDLPAGAVRLASSRAYPNQAFRCGQTSWGLQFHLEADGELLRRWLEEGSEELAAGSYIDPNEILAGIRSFEGECVGLGRKLFERFIDIAAAATEQA